MTLTHQQIQEEARELKSLLADGNVEKPGFWPCYGPGVCLMAFTLAWSVMMSVWYHGNIESVGLFAISALSMVFVFGIMAITGDYLSLLYSLPKCFRQKSKIISLIKRKIKVASVVYLFVVFFGCGFIFLYNLFMAFPFILFGSFMLIMLAVGIDLSRYQLSAFAEVSRFFQGKNTGPASTEPHFKDSIASPAGSGISTMDDLSSGDQYLLSNTEISPGMHIFEEKFTAFDSDEDSVTGHHVNEFNPATGLIMTSDYFDAGGDIYGSSWNHDHTSNSNSSFESIDRGYDDFNHH